MEALPSLSPSADVLPVAPELAAPTFGGGMVIDACAHWYASFAKDDPDLYERLKAAKMSDADAIRRALEGPDPTPIERLLVERAVVCHVALTAVEGRSCGLPVNVGAGGHAHVDRLQKRYLEALKALSQVRRMRLPAAPVFVGGQHVHVEGS